MKKCCSNQLIQKGRLKYYSDGLSIKFLLIPIQKSKLTRRRAADSTNSTARRDNEVRLFFWIGIISNSNKGYSHADAPYQTSCRGLFGAKSRAPYFPQNAATPLGCSDVSFTRGILFLRMQMQGKKRSKVGHLARLFNAADAFSGAKYTRKSKYQNTLNTERTPPCNITNWAAPA